VCKEVQASHGKLLKDWIKGIEGECVGVVACPGVRVEGQGGKRRP
jgi:hypothetical protein